LEFVWRDTGWTLFCNKIIVEAASIAGSSPATKKALPSPSQPAGKVGPAKKEEPLLQARFVVHGDDEAKTLFVKQQLARLDYSQTLTEGSCPTGERWVQDAITKLREAVEQCPHAQTLDESYQCNEKLKKFTCEGIRKYKSKDHRHADLKEVKAFGITFPVDNQLALVDRELLDIVEDTNYFASEEGSSACFAVIAAHEQDNDTPLLFNDCESTENANASKQKEFDICLPVVSHVEGTVMTKCMRSRQRVLGLLKNYCALYDTCKAQALVAMFKLEEKVSDVDYSYESLYTGTCETLLVPLRGLIALFDPSIIAFLPDVVTCVDAAAEAKKKGQYEDQHYIWVQHVASNAALEKNKKRILLQLRKTVHQKDIIETTVKELDPKNAVTESRLHKLLTDIKSYQPDIIAETYVLLATAAEAKVKTLTMDTSVTKFIEEVSSDNTCDKVKRYGEFNAICDIAEAMFPTMVQQLRTAKNRCTRKSEEERLKFDMQRISDDFNKDLDVLLYYIRVVFKRSFLWGHSFRFKPSESKTSCQSCIPTQSQVICWCCPHNTAMRIIVVV